MFCYMQVLINRNTIANVICQAGMKLTYLPYRHILLTEKNLTRLKSDVEFIRHSVRVEIMKSLVSCNCACKFITWEYISHTTYKQCSFPLRISSVNMTKSAVSCGFGHIY